MREANIHAIPQTRLWRRVLTCAAVFLLFFGAGSGAERYVKPDGGHAPPFGDWAGAARNIQAAIDVAEDGDTVLVAPGIYEAGATNAGASAFCPGYGPTRVYVNKAVTVRAASSNPAETVIKGAWDKETTNGPGAVRCVFLAAGAKLIGFTVTGGATPGTNAWSGARAGGGMACGSLTAVVSNCVISENISSGHGGGVWGGTLYGCEIRGNTAALNGGGVMGGILRRCRMERNAAAQGGGAFSAELRDCVLRGNVAGQGGGACDSRLYSCNVVSNRLNADYGAGGGIYNSAAYDSELSGNSAGNGKGGGACASRLFACFVLRNQAGIGGGGACNSRLYNCVIGGNAALYDESEGGGTVECMLYNCAVLANSAAGYGGGTCRGEAVNSIVLDNEARTGPNYHETAFSYSCARPLPEGDGNIAADPMFEQPSSGTGTNFVAGDFRLKRASPCINAGRNLTYMTDADDPVAAAWYKSDMNHAPRIRHGIVDIGPYEFEAPGLTPVTKGR